MTTTAQSIEPSLNGATTASAPLSPWEQQKLSIAEACAGDPLTLHDAYFDLFKQRALEIITSNRRISQQRHAIKAVAADLGIKLSNAEVAELYADLDHTFSTYEPDIEPGQTFEAPAQTWLLDGLFLAGLNLFVGMPGAGKSRLLVALIRAWLQGQPTFLQRSLLPGTDQHVLLVGTDQDRQQWGDLLAEQGLAVVTGIEHRDGQQKLITYRLHDRIHLKTSGGGFRLDAEGMRQVRDWNRAHPGGITVIDSLSAVLPTGVSEGDETAGRLMRQLEIARQGNTCIVTHHTNKQSAMAGEIGVYSGSGHGSIDRAVSRFVGLAYETHVEHGKEKLHEESPRRVLTSQKRGAVNQRLIVENGHGNTWDYISTAAEDRELKRADREGDAADRLKGWKKAIHEVLAAAPGDGWLTTSQVYGALPPSFASKNNASRQTQNNLRALADEALIEQDPASIGEARWRLPRC